MTLDDATRARFKQLLKDLCEIDAGLSDWVVNFIDDMAGKIDAISFITEAQRNKIEELHEAHC